MFWQRYVFLCLLAGLQSFAVTIGPVANLNIANAKVTPDGFMKTSVLHFSFL
jgi:iron transport multicopper oxidase